MAELQGSVGPIAGEAAGAIRAAAGEAAGDQHAFWQKAGLQQAQEGARKAARAHGPSQGQQHLPQPPIARYSRLVDLSMALVPEHHMGGKLTVLLHPSIM